MLDILLCGIATFVVALGAIFSVIFLLLIIQLISYRVFGFNLYKYLEYQVIDRWL